MDFFKKPVVIIIVAVAIIAALVWSYVDKRIQQNKAADAAKKAEESVQTITNLSNIDPKDYDTLVKNEYAAATAKALDANPKNVFSALVVELPGTLEVNSGNDRFIYASPTDKANNWTITFSELTGNFIRAIIPKEDYLGNLTVVNTNLWKFHYVTALQIAEKNGGKDWREKNTPTGVTLTLKHGEPNDWLTWTVEYQSKTDKLVKKIDANSGKLIENISTSGSQSESSTQ